MPRARMFLQDAEQLADALKQNFVELDWGRGLVARWDGDLVRAQASMRRALALARLREDRWREMECLVWMAKMAIEDENTAAARAFCDEIDAVAARIGDGPAPVADALRASLQVRDGNECDDVRRELLKKLAALRALDDKAQLAYVLNQIAAWRLDHGDLEGASNAATEALQAAKLVKRASEIVVATSILACIGARTGDGRIIAETSDVLDVAALDVLSLSARARAHVDRMQAALRIPTDVQTGCS